MQLHHHQEAFAQLNTRIILIGFDEKKTVRPWLAKWNIAFPLLLDEERQVYRAYEVRRSVLRAWSPANLWFYGRRLFRGLGLPRIRSDPNQLGADFLVDRQGIIQVAHYGSDPTDRPAVAALLLVLRQLSQQK
jgi:peroxiredoxin